MSKNRIKNLRNITVDGQEYKWQCVDCLKIWKDKVLIYESYDYNGKFPKVTFFDKDGIITPAIVAKIIKTINGTETIHSVEDLAYRFKNEYVGGIGYYSRNDSFDDKEAEKLWVEFNDKYEELKNYLEKTKQ